MSFELARRSSSLRRDNTRQKRETDGWKRYQNIQKKEKAVEEALVEIMMSRSNGRSWIHPQREDTMLVSKDIKIYKGNTEWKIQEWRGMLEGI